MRCITRLLPATAFALVAFAVGTADAHVMQPRVAAPSLKFTTRPAAVSAVARPKVAWTSSLVAKTTVCLLDGTTVKSCKSGLALPTLASGHHTFKVTVTNASHKSVSASIAWLTDVIAPSAPTVSGAPSGWVADPATLTAGGSTDRGGSGLSHYQYRSHVDGGAWGAVATGSQLAIPASGCTYAQFRAVDGAGNVSAWSTAARVCIDTTPPSLAPSGGSASWSNVPVTISAGATDSQSGVAGVFYETSVNGGVSWSEPTFGSSVAVSAEGTTLVRFMATDAVGNATGWTVPGATSTARIDTTPPTVTASGGSTAWTVGPVTISASVSDGGVGGGAVTHELSTDGGLTWSAPGAGASVQVTAGGATLVRFQATDALGNASGWTLPDAGSTAMIDSTAPALAPTGGSSAWGTVPVTITAGASDSQSGVQGVVYETSTNGGSSWSSPSAGSSVQVTADGTTLVRFQATDNVGNTSAWTVPDAAATARIDTTPPVVTAGGGSAAWTNQAVTISATVTDVGGTGSRTISYEISTDGGLTWSAPAPGASVQVTADGTTLVRFQAVDAVGNASAWTVPDAGSTAMVDTTAPTLSPSGGSTSWTLTDTTITSGASDSESGVASVVYETSSDGGQHWTPALTGSSVLVQEIRSTVVRFRATDHAGNTSAWSVPDANSTVMRDGGPPDMTITGGSANWSQGPVTISAAASESVSGIASISYETSSDSGHTWSAPQPGSSVTISAQGVTEVAFEAIDNAGATSDFLYDNYASWAKIDSVAPTLAPSGGSAAWSTAPVTVTAGAADSGSGVASVVYETSTDGGQTWSQPQAGSSAAIGTNGTTLVRFQATDVAGNTSGWTVPGAGSTAAVDTMAPTVSIDGSVNGDASSVTFAADATDQTSGVASVSYEMSADSGSTWSAPVAGDSVSFTPDGATEVRFEAVDNAGNSSGWLATGPATWESIDTSAPSLAPTGGSTSWSGTPVTIRAGATDDLSGVASVVYETSTDGGQTWSQPQSGASVTVAANGTTVVRFQATDLAGNTSDWTIPDANSTAVVDTTAPTVSASGGSNTFTTGPVTITATAQDAGSGVASVVYETAYQGGAWSAPQAGNTVTVTVAGLTSVRFQATDAVGNASAWVVGYGTEALIDTTPPTISVHASTSAWTTTSPVVTATVTDTAGPLAGSGVVSVVSETSTDGGQTWSPPVAGTSVTSFAQGVSEVRFQATDQVGNTSSWTTPVTVQFDSAAPSIAPSGWDPVAGQEPVLISANASDAVSGVQQVWYRTWNPATDFWSARVAGSSAEIDTTATLVQFQAQDYAGNLSPWVQADTFSQLVDTQPPVLAPSGGSPAWSPIPVTVSANASDDESGVAGVVYEKSTDGGVTWSAATPGAAVTLTSSGMVRFQATDNAGNVSAWVGPNSATTVLIDSTPPVTAPSGGSSSWTAGPVTISANATDQQSGIRAVSYEVSYDGGTTWYGSQLGSSVTLSTGGITEVRFQATDAVGNVSGWSVPTSATTSKIDVTPPTVSPNGGSLSTATRPVTITAGAADTQSGVATTQYEQSVNGGATWSAPETGSSVTVSRMGTTLVRFRAIDAAGNTGAWSVPDAGSTVVMDDPLTLTPTGGNGSSAWSLGPVTVSAGEQDTASASVSVEYETSGDGGATWSAPQPGDSVSVSADGATLVRFEASDDAGNLATWSIPDANSTADIDLSPPTFAPSGGGTPAIGSETIQAGAVDTGSGIQSVFYETSTDGGSTWSPAQPGSSVTVTGVGSTAVRFQATDNLGNTSDWTTPNAASTAFVENGQVDIMLVVDRTGSMAGTDFTNEKTGLLTGLLPGLNPAADNVGMAVFPPDSNGPTNVCSAQSSGSYNSASALYTVVPLGNSYMNSSGQLVSTSPLVSTLSCIKAGGGTDYANALEAAEAELLTDGRPLAKKVIILMSDGAANSGANCPAQRSNGTWPTSTDPHCTNPCGTGVSDAQSYQATGVIVYAVEDSGGQGTEACQNWTGANESPAITPQAALLGMATPGDFFNVADPTTLPAVFQSVVTGVIGP